MTINFNLVIIGFLVGAGGATIATQFLIPTISEEQKRTLVYAGLPMVIVGILWALATV